MWFRVRLCGRYFWLLFATTGLVACGSGSSSMNNAQTLTGYAMTALVADTAGVAANTDPHLVNPWGIAFPPSGDVWTANNGTQTSTLYDGNGVMDTNTIVTLPQGTAGDPDPTGIVYNSTIGYTPGVGNTGDFVITQGSASALAQFIFDGEGGTLSGWAPTVSNNAVLMYDDGSGGAVYKGLALAAVGNVNYLYAADFHNSKIDVFNSSFSKVSGFAFIDSGLPAGFAPFNIQNVNGNLVVTYAEQLGPANHDEVDGAGLGYVDVYSTAGAFQGRLVSGGVLNAPWGIALAPANFGSLGGKLLIGNFGDGMINAFDPATGQFAGSVKTPQGAVIATPGLWGMAFGNGSNNQPAATLFFAAGTSNEAHGLYGRIDPMSATGTTGGGGGY